MARRLLLLTLLVAGAACAPRLVPLPGTPTHRALPVLTLPPGHRQIVFDWVLEDPELSGKGEGVARVAAPDSVRLDFFLAGGFGGGAAILIGDSLQLPGMDFVRRLIPPPPMLWAALGRTALPAVRDTVVRVDGSLLRADLGRPAEWRVTFRGDTLVALHRIDAGRVGGSLTRDSTQVQFRDSGARRTLTFRITSVSEAAPFDASIWRCSR